MIPALNNEILTKNCQVQNIFTKTFWEVNKFIKRTHFLLMKRRNKNMFSCRWNMKIIQRWISNWGKNLLQVQQSTVQLAHPSTLQQVKMFNTRIQLQTFVYYNPWQYICLQDNRFKNSTTLNFYFSCSCTLQSTFTYLQYSFFQSLNVLEFNVYDVHD